MNIVFIAVIVLVLFVYFGGKNVPDVLKKNKEMLLGFVVGLVASSFMGGNLVEGNDNGDGDGACEQGMVKQCVGINLKYGQDGYPQAGDSCEDHEDCGSMACKCGPPMRR